MSALPVATLRQRCASTMPSGFNESAQLFDLFGTDPSALHHKAFAIGVTETSRVENDRSRRSEGTLVFTQVVVRCSYVIPPGDQVNSYDTALGLEQSVITAFNGITQTDIGGFSFESATRRKLTADWLVSEVTFTFQHRIALS